MPIYENGPVCISYVEAGSGFPLLNIPGGGLNATMAGVASHAFNPMEEFAVEYRCITMDLRNANGGASSGPPEVDPPWESFAEHQPGLLEDRGGSRFPAMG